MTRQSEVFIATQYHELSAVIRQRMAVLTQEADQAARVLEDHLQALNQDNVYERIVQYLSPFS